MSNIKYRNLVPIGSKYYWHTLLIYDLFSIIQNLQTCPIPPTSFLVGTFFAAYYTMTALIRKRFKKSAKGRYKPRWILITRYCILLGLLSCKYSELVSICFWCFGIKPIYFISLRFVKTTAAYSSFCKWT